MAKCECCGRETPGDEPWNTSLHHSRILCAGCHWDPNILMSKCKHSGTEESYFATLADMKDQQGGVPV